jgi:hypothetical protein
MSYISENSMPKEEDVEVQRDRLYYSWHRMLYLIQNPILLEASIFQTAIFGISRLVDEFLAFGTKLVEVIVINLENRYFRVSCKWKYYSEYVWGMAI